MLNNIDQRPLRIHRKNKDVDFMKEYQCTRHHNKGLTQSIHTTKFSQQYGNLKAKVKLFNLVSGRCFCFVLFVLLFWT